MTFQRMIWLSMSIRLHRDLVGSQQKLAIILIPCYPAAAFAIVLREIAIELDKKYEDHISNSPEIYSISLVDGRITKLYKSRIRSYKNFAAFRTIDDAKFACKVLREVLKDMFRDGK